MYSSEKAALHRNGTISKISNHSKQRFLTPNRHQGLTGKTGRPWKGKGKKKKKAGFGASPSEAQRYGYYEKLGSKGGDPLEEYTGQN